MSPAATPNPALGRLLRAARERAGLTQAHAADVLHISHGSYSRVEAGRMKLTTRELASLLGRFGVTRAQVRRELAPQALAEQPESPLMRDAINELLHAAWDLA